MCSCSAGHIAPGRTLLFIVRLCFSWFASKVNLRKPLCFLAKEVVKKKKKVSFLSWNTFGCQPELLVGKSEVGTGNVHYFSSHCFSCVCKKGQVSYTDYTSALSGVNY